MGLFGQWWQPAKQGSMRAIEVSLVKIFISRPSMKKGVNV